LALFVGNVFVCIAMLGDESLVGVTLIFVGADSDVVGFARYVFDSVEEQSNCRMLIGPETTRIFNSIASADGRGVYCDWPSREEVW